MRKFLLSYLFGFFSLPVFASSLQTTFLPNSVQDPSSESKNRLTNVIQDAVGSNPVFSQYSTAKYQVHYNANQQISYLIVYLLGISDYSLKILKLEINQDFQVTHISEDYKLSSEDYSQQVYSASETKCPDESLEFVAATPVPEYPTASKSVLNVYLSALSSGYNANILEGENATIAWYMNIFACPNLKGFYSVGHGYNRGILLADGFLGTDYFQSLNGQLKGKVVEFNSCEVDNPPLNDAIINGAGAQKFIGGITLLRVGPSEAASECFWGRTFEQQRMTRSLSICSFQYDNPDLFGIEGDGNDYLEKAMKSSLTPFQAL